VHSATIQARAYNLEEQLQTQKSHGEKLRTQLTASAERSSRTSELLLKVETLTDELTHRKSQLDARTAMCDELSLSLEAELGRRESAEQEVHQSRHELDCLQQELNKCQHENDQLQAEQQSTSSKLQQSISKIALLETMKQQIVSDDNDNKSQFDRNMQVLLASIGQLQANAEAFETSYPRKSICGCVESCSAAMELLEREGSAQQTRDQDQRQDQTLPTCTQVHSSPDPSMRKTVSGDSTIAFSRHPENSEFTQVVGATVEFAEATKLACHHSEHRQNSVYDTINMTEDDIDIGKIEEG
jgi:chromosome segregation ATPase